jgi:3-oxoacyl-[acyl-carrier protein] reductase
MFNLNICSLFIAARESEKFMENGRIVSIGSINGDHSPGCLYGATKAAVAGLSRGWARDLECVG